MEGRLERRLGPFGGQGTNSRERLPRGGTQEWVGGNDRIENVQRTSLRGSNPWADVSIERPRCFGHGHLAGHSTTLSMDYKYGREERTLSLTRSGECGRGKEPRATHRVPSYMTHGLQCTLHHSQEEGINIYIRGMRCWNLGWGLHLGRTEKGTVIGDENSGIFWDASIVSVFIPRSSRVCFLCAGLLSCDLRCGPLLFSVRVL